MGVRSIPLRRLARTAGASFSGFGSGASAGASPSIGSPASRVLTGVRPTYGVRSGVLTGYSRGTLTVRSQYCGALSGVLTGYSQGTPDAQGTLAARTGGGGRVGGCRRQRPIVVAARAAEYACRIKSTPTATGGLNETRRTAGVKPLQSRCKAVVKPL